MSRLFEQKFGSERNEKFYGNCVGAAYAAIGYGPDGLYPTQEILARFHEVPVDEAEIVVIMENVFVLHVAAFERNRRFVTQRPDTGLVTENGVPIENVIKMNRLFKQRTIYMLRNDPSYYNHAVE